MVYHMLWLVCIHTKPEYPFPAETSWPFPEINAVSAESKVNSHIAELWDILLQDRATHGVISIMNDSVSLSLAWLLTISMVRPFTKPVTEYFWQEIIACRKCHCSYFLN